MKIPSSLRWKATGRELGRGAQASVVQVSDEQGEFEGTYALKGLATGRPAKVYQRFVREINAIKKLDHPTIIKILDHSAPDDEFQYYVMEYIEGARSLKQLLGKPENPFQGDPLKSLKLFKQLAAAIGQWHGVGIVHRDLSPANVLILPDENTKVIDLGVCFEEDGQQVTLIDEGVGSRNYTAPECESGGGGPVTIAADFYSAGKILWAAITNQQAFLHEDLAFTKKAMNQIFPNSQFWHLHHVFEKTIRRQISDRFGTASDAHFVATCVERLITNGYPPLEIFADRRICPICGWGELTEFPVMNHSFGGHKITGFRCSFCGVCFPIDTILVNSHMERRQTLK